MGGLFLFVGSGFGWWYWLRFGSCFRALGGLLGTWAGLSVIFWPCRCLYSGLSIELEPPVSIFAVFTNQNLSPSILIKESK